MQTCGDADDEDLSKDSKVHAQALEVEMAGSVGSKHIDEDEDAGDPMGSGGCNSNAARALVKSDDHNKVEQDVSNARNGKKDERTHGVARGAKHGGAVVVDHVGDHARKVGAHIGNGLREDGGIGAHHFQEGLCGGHADDGDDDTAEECGDDRGVDDALHVVVALSADGMRHADAGAHRKSHEEIDDKIDEGSARANGGKRVFAFVRCGAAPTSNHDGIGGVKQKMENAGCDEGKGEENNSGEQGAARKILYGGFFDGFCHTVSLLRIPPDR